MTSPTKLTEGSARIPDAREARVAETVREYLSVIEPLKGEAQRSLRFALLVQELLGLEPKLVGDYVHGVERYVSIRQKDRVLRGRVDNLFGNLIIEFESSIPRKLAEAEEQLRNYVAILWSQEPPESRRPYLCMATDGVRFEVYSPTTEHPASEDVLPDEVRLQPGESCNWSEFRPIDVLFWLDRYFVRREQLRPTSEEMVKDFGPKSHAFQTTTSSLLNVWARIAEQRPFSVIYESWQKYLAIVYGSSVGERELFVRHTYLATLAKLLSWKRMAEPDRLGEVPEIVLLLQGKIFREYGVDNFIEEDFFSWLAREQAVQVGIGVVRGLFSILQSYNLRELSEDVLKSLYQELVDPETRHDLGEFYTPDWLAHRIVNRLLDDKPEGSVLDPACGSGTFLYLAIREKRRRLGDSLKTLDHILSSVCGMDVHPLAVITAKTNYILALGDLLKARGTGRLRVPVYLANSIRLPELDPTADLFLELRRYGLDIGNRRVRLPELLFRDRSLHDCCIDGAREFAEHSKGKSITLESFRKFMSTTCPSLPTARRDALTRALYEVAETLKELIEEDNDTIWAFILKNSYKPLFLKGSFDFLVGNPPWLAYRFTEGDYRGFLKRQITEEYGLLKGRGELITHLELATLFLVRAADLYLKNCGAVAFVLPKSVFSADQHDGLRSRSFRLPEDKTRSLIWEEVWDCENVEPLFSQSSCVLIGQKCGKDAAQESVLCRELSGNLERRNASLSEAESSLHMEESQVLLHKRGARSYWAVGPAPEAHGVSPYKEAFAQGATIFPRSFWFVQVRPSPVGIDPGRPPLDTSNHAKENAKPAYKSVDLHGAVEDRFLYATLLSTDLLPFGRLDYRLLLLPIRAEEHGYGLLDSDSASRSGFIWLSKWLQSAEAEWHSRRGLKAEHMSIYERLDRYGGLTKQKPESPYRVLYTSSATHLTAAVVEDERIAFDIQGQQVEAKGFVAESKTYCHASPSQSECCYLASVLNAPVTDCLIKSMQSRGLWGARDVHKKVLDLPIPLFDEGNPAHVRLAELGELCTAKVKRWVEHERPVSIKSIGKLRGMVRDALREELREIDAIVQRILRGDTSE